MHGERNNRHKADDNVAEGAVPAYLLDREATARAKVGDRNLSSSLPLFQERRTCPLLTLFPSLTAQVLSNTIKQKRKEKAGKWEVPLPKVSCCCRRLRLYVLFPLCPCPWLNAGERVVWCGLAQVRPIAEDEMFRVVRSGKRKSESGLPCARVSLCA